MSREADKKIRVSVRMGQKIKALEAEVNAHEHKKKTRVVEREKARDKTLDNELASIPTKLTVNEWAQSATRKYLEDSGALEEITLAVDTATSSITAFSGTGLLPSVMKWQRR